MKEIPTKEEILALLMHACILVFLAGWCIVGVGLIIYHPERAEEDWDPF